MILNTNQALLSQGPKGYPMHCGLKIKLFYFTDNLYIPYKYNITICKLQSLNLDPRVKYVYHLIRLRHRIAKFTTAHVKWTEIMKQRTYNQLH